MYNFNRKATHQHVGSAEDERAEPVQLPVVEEAPPPPETVSEHANAEQDSPIDDSGDDGEENENAFDYDPTFQDEEQQQQQQQQGQEQEQRGEGDGDRKGSEDTRGTSERPPRATKSLLASGYNTSGAMNRFQAKRGMTILSEYVPPPQDASEDAILAYFRNLVQKHNATPPKPWRQIRFDLPATVAELRLVPPSPEKVQYKTPVTPSPCLVLLLDGAIPEGMSQKDYMVQMIQYLLDLMKYNNAATAITTLKFIKKGNELSQLVVTFGLDVRLAVKMLNSLQDAGVRAGFGQPIQDYKPNATFAVNDYKLVMNNGAGVSREQVERFLTPFRETNTVDITVIDGYNKGVFYAPVKRPETVYSIIWNPYISVLMQAELFARLGLLITMAECPHFFLEKGVPYHIQKQQMEIEKAKILLQRQQRGDVDAGEDELGNVYDYVHTVGEQNKESRRPKPKAGGSDDDGIFSDDDDDAEKEDGGGRHAGSGATPTWVAQAAQVSIFSKDDMVALKRQTEPNAPPLEDSAKPPSRLPALAAATSDMTLMAGEAERRMTHMLKKATAKAALPAQQQQPAKATLAYPAGQESSSYPPFAGARGPPAAAAAAPPSRFGARNEAPPPFAERAVAADTGAVDMDLPELVSDHDEDDDVGNGYARGPAGVVAPEAVVRSGAAADAWQRPPMDIVFGGGQAPPPQPVPETFLSWNMASPGGVAGGAGGGGHPSAAGMGPSSSQANFTQRQALPEDAGGPAFDGIDGPGYDDGYAHDGEGRGRVGVTAGDGGRANTLQWGPEVAEDNDGSGYGWGSPGPHQHQPQGMDMGMGGPYGAFAPPPPGPYGYGFISPPGQQQQQQQQGGYDSAYFTQSNDGAALSGARSMPLPMSQEEADALVAKVQDRVRNAFPSLRIVDPADADAMTEMFFSTDASSAAVVPEVVAPSQARVPVPTAEMDELTDVLEAEYPMIKALLECYEPPLQEARARLAITLMVSKPQQEQAKDWVTYVEQSSDDDDGGEDEGVSGTAGTGNGPAAGGGAAGKAGGEDEMQLPALLPYLLTTHEGTELCAMLATFYPQEFIGLFARYCLPFLLDNDVVQWVCLSALRTDPSPNNPLASRVLQHWVPLVRWLNAYILQQAENEEGKKNGEAVSLTAATPPPTTMSSSAVAKRLVSQLGNTMDLLLSGLSPSQRNAAANANKAGQTVRAFVDDLAKAAPQDMDRAVGVSALLWGADGAARRTLLRLYLSADIIDGCELAAALFTEGVDSAGQAVRVHAVSSDSFYFLLVALSKSLLSPSLNVQTAAFCGRYLQYMEVLAGEGESTLKGKEGAERADRLREKEGVQLVEAAFKNLTYLDAYHALRQGYLVAAAPVSHFPAVHAKLSNEVPPFPLAARPQELYADPAAAYMSADPYQPQQLPLPPQQDFFYFDPNFYGGAQSMGGPAYAGSYGGDGGYGFASAPPPLASGGGLLDGGSPATPQPRQQEQQNQQQQPEKEKEKEEKEREMQRGSGGEATAPKPIDWAVVMKSYPASGEPFTPLPAGWTASLSRSFGQYYFKPSGSLGGSPSYTHPTDKTTFYASPQAFIKAEANQAAALHEVIQLANAHRRQRLPSAAPLTRGEVDAWLNDQRKRDAWLDAATLEKFSIHYKSTTSTAAAGRKRSRSPAAGRAADKLPSASAAPLTPAQLSARLSRMKNYPAKGAPFPDVFRGWSTNISSSTGLYVFRPPAGRRGGSEAQETHPATKRRYRVSPQEFVRHRNLTNEAIAKEAKVEVVEVEEWMTDQRYRSAAMDAAVTRLARVNYAFCEELDAERGGPSSHSHSQRHSQHQRREEDASERSSRHERERGRRSSGGGAERDDRSRRRGN